jgi:hypothetical protein
MSVLIHRQQSLYESGFLPSTSDIILKIREQNFFSLLDRFAFYINSAIDVHPII